MAGERCPVYLNGEHAYDQRQEIAVTVGVECRCGKSLAAPRVPYDELASLRARLALAEAVIEAAKDVRRYLYDEGQTAPLPLDAALQAFDRAANAEAELMSDPTPFRQCDSCERQAMAGAVLCRDCWSDWYNEDPYEDDDDEPSDQRAKG